MQKNGLNQKFKTGVNIMCKQITVRIVDNGLVFQDQSTGMPGMTSEQSEKVYTDEQAITALKDEIDAYRAKQAAK